MLNFENDYMRGACPEVMQALARTNMEQTLGYGDDPYTAAAVEKIREACGCPEAQIHLLIGGTQVNALAACAVLRHCQGVMPSPPVPSSVIARASSRPSPATSTITSREPSRPPGTRS